MEVSLTGDGNRRFPDGDIKEKRAFGREFFFEN
jgi:hypothetical protein